MWIRSKPLKTLGMGAPRQDILIQERTDVVVKLGDGEILKMFSTSVRIESFRTGRHTFRIKISRDPNHFTWLLQKAKPTKFPFNFKLMIYPTCSVCEACTPLNSVGFTFESSAVGKDAAVPGQYYQI